MRTSPVPNLEIAGFLFSVFPVLSSISPSPDDNSVLLYINWQLAIGWRPFGKPPIYLTGETIAVVSAFRALPQPPVIEFRQVLSPLVRSRILTHLQVSITIDDALGYFDWSLLALWLSSQSSDFVRCEPSSMVLLLPAWQGAIRTYSLSLPKHFICCEVVIWEPFLPSWWTTIKTHNPSLLAALFFSDASRIQYILDPTAPPPVPQEKI